MEQEVSFRKMFSQWHVSVPLRGFWYSDKEAGISNRLWDDMFQSPYGDFGTLTPTYERYANGSTSCFSPLTGILVL